MAEGRHSRHCEARQSHPARGFPAMHPLHRSFLPTPQSTTPPDKRTPKKLLHFIQFIGPSLSEIKYGAVNGPGKIAFGSSAGQPVYNMRGGIAYERSMRYCAIGRYLNFSSQDCSAARTVGNPKTDRKVGQMVFRMPKTSLDSAPDLHCSEPLEQVLLCYAAEFALF